MIELGSGTGMVSTGEMPYRGRESAFGAKLGFAIHEPVDSTFRPTIGAVVPSSLCCRPSMKPLPVVSVPVQTCEFALAAPVMSWLMACSKLPDQSPPPTPLWWT